MTAINCDITCFKNRKQKSLHWSNKKCQIQYTFCFPVSLNKSSSAVT